MRGSATGSSGGGTIAATKSGSTRNSTESIWAPPKRGAPIAASIRATSAAVLTKPTGSALKSLWRRGGRGVRRARGLRGQPDRDRVAKPVGEGDAEALVHH